jgi:GNAT superfamily N-acetyltransferase
VVTSQVLTPWMGSPARVLVADDPEGPSRAPVGWALLELPTRDNTHSGLLEFQVDPAHRRRGVGAALWDAAVTLMRDEGRRLLIVEAREDSPLAEFLQVRGATRGQLDVGRHQRLDSVDAGLVARLLSGAEAASAGYRVVGWTGPAPEEQLSRVVDGLHALNDAPMGELDYGPERWDPGRVRRRDLAVESAGLRMHTLVAIAPDGSTAGSTEVAVAEDGAFAWQWGTSVAPAHRGHRLGMLLKASMVRRLRAEEPALTVVSTWNADSNTHMVAINDALGYVPVERMGEWQLDVRVPARTPG